MSAIVLPLDGSPLSENALPYAAALARPDDATIHMVRAVWSRVPTGIDPTESQLRTTREARREQDVASAGLRASGVRVEQHVVLEERPEVVILDVARGCHARLIVMSTHGRSGLGRFVYGSVAERVMAATDRPLLVVPAVCVRDWVSRDEPGHRQVVVPLDGSDHAEVVVGPATDLAVALDAGLLLLRVVEPVDSEAKGVAVAMGLPEERDRISAADRYLDGLVERLGGRRAPVHVTSLAGDPAIVVSRLAHETTVVAVAMATHGRSGIARVLMGSVTTAVLHRIAIPMLIVRPRALAR